MYDVITIGSATRDVFLISKEFKMIRSSKFESGIGECVSLGSKIEVDKMVLTTGGGSTNSAATFGSLGFNTAVITRIGDDAPGRDVLEDLKRFGAKTTLVKQVKESTGYSTLLTTTTGERTVLVHRGASAHFKASDIPWSKLKTKWLYLTSLGGDAALALRLVKRAQKDGLKVAFNPGKKELRQGLRIMRPIFKYLTILNLNLEEAQLLTKMKSRDVAALCKKIDLDGLTTIVTDGPNGAYAYLDGTTWYARTRGIKGISKTGAGDAYGSALVAGLMKNWGIDAAMQLGMINAESVIQEHGAKNGIISGWPNKKTLNQVKIRQIS